MPKIVIVADLDLGPSFTEPDVKQFILDNLPCWVELAISRQNVKARGGESPEIGYGLTNTTVYYGLEDFDTDRAEGLDHFAIERSTTSDVSMRVGCLNGESKEDV